MLLSSSEMLLLTFLYYLVVFSRPDKDILKQHLLKIPAPGVSQVSLCVRGDTWIGPFLGGVWKGEVGPCPSPGLEPLPACSHCSGVK